MGTDSSAQQSKRHGFSLVESAIVLGVVGLVLGGIWVASAAMYENYKVNKTVEGIFTTASNIQNLISIRDAKQQWGTTGAGVSVTNSVMGLGVFPVDWLNGSQIISPFGIVQVHDFSEYTGVPADETFLISLNSVSKSVCIKLAVEISKKNIDNSRNGLRMIQINYPVWYANILGPQKFPVPVGQASAACTNQINNNFRVYFPYTRTN